MYKHNTDLPDEHGHSQSIPTTTNFHGHTHKAAKIKKPSYAVTPPTRARTFSSYVGTNVGDSKILGTDTKRRSLLIQNRSADSIFVGLGTPPSFDGVNYTDSFEVNSGQSYETPAGYSPTNDVYIVGENNGSHVVISEAVIAL